MRDKKNQEIYRRCLYVVVKKVPRADLEMPLIGFNDW